MNQDVNEGDEVRHELFGAGRVFSIDPISSIATIDFAARGRKRIHASSRFEIVARGEIFLVGQEEARQQAMGVRQKAEEAEQQARRKAQEDNCKRAAELKK